MISEATAFLPLWTILFAGFGFLTGGLAATTTVTARHFEQVHRRSSKSTQEDLRQRRAAGNEAPARRNQ
jgi:hypothetical protein